MHVFCVESMSVIHLAESRHADAREIPAYLPVPAELHFLMATSQRARLILDLKFGFQLVVTVTSDACPRCE